MANETWKFVQAKSKQAMKQVLGIRDEKARMKVTPPLAVAKHYYGHCATATAPAAVRPVRANVRVIPCMFPR